jgi:hypothetical protein
VNVRTSRRGISLLGSEPRSRSPAIGCAAALAIGLAALPGRAAAEPAIRAAPGPLLTVDGLPGRRVVVDAPVDPVAPLAMAPRTLYLNRCSGGCVITRGNNDARNHVSSIPNPTATAPGPSFTIGEYRDVSNRSGAGADAEWGQLVKCMKDVYSPYNLTVTDVKPAPGTGYDEAIIAGSPTEIGQSLDVLGVAPLASDCSAIDNVISFSFANAHGTLDRVNNVCWTAAQESAHAYGLDHEYSFTTGNPANDHSACSDPMTYRNDCGGEKFFRNDFAHCGETGNRACKCSRTQNSHLKLLSVFGASAAPPIVQAPTATLGSPAQTDALLGPTVVVTAGGQRGVARVELDFNGFQWVEAPGAMFAPRGQPNPSTYTIAVPSSLPSSIVDVKAIAYDDLGTATATASVTVTRSAPCTTATACAAYQKCDAGRCLWDPPVGELGVACAYPQFCKSGICKGTADQPICTQPCIPGYVSCPQGFDCVMDASDTGMCLFSSSGCCSVGRGGGAWWLPVGFGLAVLGLVARPRRRRR